MNIEKYKYLFHQKIVSVKRRFLFAFLRRCHLKAYKSLLRGVLVSFIVSLGFSEGLLYLAEVVNCLAGWPLDVKANDFITIVAAGIGAAGVFLALYCSNIAAVFSARYSKAPEEVFHLFMNSFVTSIGVKAVLLYIVYSFCFIYRLWKASETSYFLTGIWCFFTILIVLIFGKLGQQSLILTDAFRLLRGEYEDASSSFKLLDKKSILAVGRASENIRGVVLNSLRNMAILESNAFSNGDFSKGSLLTFMRLNIALLWQYMAIKEKIPFDSPWFPQEQVYPKWYETPDYQRQIAVSRGSGIMPKVIKNSYFIEQWLSWLNLRGIPHLLQDSSLGYYQDYFKVLGQYLSSGFPLSEHGFMGDCIFDIQNQWSNEWGKNEQVESVTVVAENIGFLYTAYLVGVLRKVQSVNVKAQVIYATCCHNFEDMDFSKTPFSNIKECRNLLEQINNEMTVSGKTLTPLWFVQQYHAKMIFDGVEKIKLDTYKLGTIRMKQLLDEIYSRKEYIALAHLLIRLREYRSKWKLLAEEIEDVKDKCRGYRIDMETYPWMESKMNFDLKWKETEDTASDMRIDALSHLVSDFDAYKQWFQKNMDVLGLLYDMESQWIVDCIAGNDIVKFVKAYGKYRSITIAYSRIIARTIETEGKNLLWALDQVYNPVIDFITVSGYVLLWGEAIGDRRWKEAVENASEAKLGVELMQIFKSWNSHQIVDIDEKRFTWNREIEEAIDKLPVVKDAYESSPSAFSSVNEEQERNPILANCLKKNFNQWYIDIDAIKELYPVFILNKSVPSKMQYKSRWDWGAGKCEILT